MPSDRADGDRVEHFLVDGVAPPVIGGGPPESPFDLEPEPESEPRHRSQPAGPTPRGPGAAPGDPARPPIGTPFGQPGTGPSYDHTQHPGYERSAGREPPTAPIPVLNPPSPSPSPSPEQEKRKSWVSRVLRLPDR